MTYNVSSGTLSLYSTYLPDFKCVQKPTESRPSLTHHADKSSRWLFRVSHLPSLLTILVYTAYYRRSRCFAADYIIFNSELIVVEHIM